MTTRKADSLKPVDLRAAPVVVNSCELLLLLVAEVGTPRAGHLTSLKQLAAPARCRTRKTKAFPAVHVCIETSASPGKSRSQRRLVHPAHGEAHNTVVLKRQPSSMQTRLTTTLSPIIGAAYGHLGCFCFLHATSDAFTSKSKMKCGLAPPQKQ